MAQFLRPDGQISTGSWTNNWSAIDEATPSDADLAYSQNNPNGSIFEVSLSNPSGTPGAGTTTVRYRHAQVNSGVVSGTGTATALDAMVVQGTTIIATDAQQAPGGSWVTRTWAPDLSAVTDWNDVRLRFTATGGGGSPASRRGVGVSWAELEVPDAATAITGTMAASETGSDTFAASGAVADPAVTGTLAATETGLDSASASGTVAIAGTLGASETGGDSASMAGNVPVSGSLVANEGGNDSATASGAVAVTGTMGGLETGADGFAASGTVGSTGVTGTLAASETGADTAAASGLVLIQGGLAASEAGTDIATAAGTLAIAGTFAALEAANDNFSGAGNVTSGGALTGALAAVETGFDGFEARGGPIPVPWRDLPPSRVVATRRIRRIARGA